MALDLTDATDSDVVFTAKINGQERQVTLAQAKRYAEQVGSMAEQAQVLKDQAQEVDEWRRFKQGFQTDPHGTLAQLAEASGGRYSDGSDDDEEEEVDPVKAQVAALERQIAALKGDLTGFQAQTGVEREVERLRAAHPKMTDTDLQAVYSKASAYGGLPLEEAYKLVQFEAISKEPEGDGTLSQTPGKGLPITKGDGTPASMVGAKDVALDYTKPLKELMDPIWEKVKAETGITD